MNLADAACSILIAGLQMWGTSASPLHCGIQMATPSPRLWVAAHRMMVLFLTSRISSSSVGDISLVAVPVLLAVPTRRRWLLLAVPMRARSGARCFARRLLFLHGQHRYDRRQCQNCGGCCMGCCSSPPLHALSPLALLVCYIIAVEGWQATRRLHATAAADGVACQQRGATARNTPCRFVSPLAGHAPLWARPGTRRAC